MLRIIYWVNLKKGQENFQKLELKEKAKEILQSS